MPKVLKFYNKNREKKEKKKNNYIFEKISEKKKNTHTQ